MKVDPPVHFLCYSSGAVAVMRRLLAKKGDLKGFTLTFIPWTYDIIKDPTKPGITEFSQEAYQDLLNELQKDSVLSLNRAILTYDKGYNRSFVPMPLP